MVNDPLVGLPGLYLHFITCPVSVRVNLIIGIADHIHDHFLTYPNVDLLTAGEWSCLWQ